VHIMDLGAMVYVPAPQNVHAVALFRGENVPGIQSVHVASKANPVDLPYVPEGQAMRNAPPGQ
jgi:hypothetical protein